MSDYQHPTNAAEHIAEAARILEGEKDSTGDVYTTERGGDPNAIAAAQAHATIALAMLTQGTNGK